MTQDEREHTDNMQVLLRALKALADESRLRMLGILAQGERSVEELAAMLALRPPTVSHHLARLKELGLVEMRAEGNAHLYALNREALRELNRLLLTPERIVGLVQDVPGDAWERKVLRDFFEGERLKEIPASRKKREVILRWLADRFERGRAYTEAEVNETLTRHHPDAATLRRELIGSQLMRREGGVYRRTGQAPDA